MTFMQKRRPTWGWVYGNTTAAVLGFAAIAAFALAIVALGGGFEGWTLIAAIVAVVFAGLTVLAYVGGRRHVREPRNVVYGPDNPPVRLDVDQRTGRRRLHREDR